MKQLTFSEKFFFTSFLIIIIFTTNSHFSYEETLIYGAADGESYFLISKYAPGIPNEKIQPIHSERFIFPYIIGLLSKLLNFEIFNIYKVASIVVVFLIIYYFTKIINKYYDDKYVEYLGIVLILFNPYISRFYIANPTVVLDLIFHLGILLFLHSLIYENKWQTIISIIILTSARQSAVAILAGLFFYTFANNYKKKEALTFLFINTLVFVLINIVNFKYSSQTISYSGERSDQYLITIFGIFLENKSFYEIVLFFVWPFLSFGPLIFFLILFFDKPKKKLLFKNINICILIISLLLIFQPFLSGVDVTGKNIIRLTTLSYIPLQILIFKNLVKFHPKKHLFKFYFLVLINILWSCHPTFSIFNFMEQFNF